MLTPHTHTHARTHTPNLTNAFMRGTRTHNEWISCQGHARGISLSLSLRWYGNKPVGKACARLAIIDCISTQITGHSARGEQWMGTMRDGRVA